MYADLVQMLSYLMVQQISARFAVPYTSFINRLRMTFEKQRFRAKEMAMQRATHHAGTFICIARAACTGRVGSADSARR